MNTKAVWQVQNNHVMSAFRRSELRAVSWSEVYEIHEGLMDASKEYGGAHLGFYLLQSNNRVGIYTGVLTWMGADFRIVAPTLPNTFVLFNTTDGVVKVKEYLKAVKEFVSNVKGWYLPDAAERGWAKWEDLVSFAKELNGTLPKPYLTKGFFVSPPTMRLSGLMPVGGDMLGLHEGEAYRYYKQLDKLYDEYRLSTGQQQYIRFCVMTEAAMPRDEQMTYVFLVRKYSLSGMASLITLLEAVKDVEWSPENALPTNIDMSTLLLPE